MNRKTLFLANKKREVKSIKLGYDFKRRTIYYIQMILPKMTCHFTAAEYQAESVFKALNN
jgi:hypothetical protein